MNANKPSIDIVALNDPEWTKTREEIQNRLIAAGSDLLKHTGADQVQIHFPTGCVTVHRHGPESLDG